jgi:hypothetical protein
VCQFIKSDQTIVIFYQSKTGLRMPLASSVKELGAILQKLIKNVNLDKIQHENFADGASIGDADRLLQLLQAVGDVRLGANESAKRKQFCSLKN